MDIDPTVSRHKILNPDAIIVRDGWLCDTMLTNPPVLSEIKCESAKAALKQEKALVEAFFVIVKSSQTFV